MLLSLVGTVGGAKGLVHYELVPEGQTVSGAFYLEVHCEEL